MPGASEVAAARADRIRLAEQADLPRVHELTVAAYARYQDRMDRTPRPALTDHGPAITAAHVWVTGAPIIGLIVLIPVDDAMLIENVAVDPAAQGTGLGRLLLEFAEEHARAAGLSRLKLYTNELMTENQAIYARFGYRETARRTDQGYRVVFMEKPLPPAR